MITSKQIINIMESWTAPEDDKELLDKLFYIFPWIFGTCLDKIEAGWFGQPMFLFFKRNVPDVMYSGKCYRKIYLKISDFQELGIIPPAKLNNFGIVIDKAQSRKDALNVTTKQIRQIIQKDKKILAKMTSWTKDPSRLNSVKKPFWSDTIKVVIVDHVTGIDVEAIVEFTKQLIKKIKKEDLSAWEKYQDMWNSEGALRRLASLQKEVVAPLDISSFQVVSIGKGT
jgi:hypothetical protein